MKKIRYKRFIILGNSLLFFSILDLKTQLNYISIFFKKEYKTIYLSNKIIHYPSFLFLYLFSTQKNFLITYNKYIINKIKHFYINYKLFIELIGTGYKFFFKNNFLYLVLGYSHLIKIKLPIICTNKIENNYKLLILTYPNKYILGNIFYIIMSCKQFNIYKGKGIKNMLIQIKLKLNKLKKTINK